jgi:drug/metabolite transporter (DMT)-like permease
VASGLLLGAHFATWIPSLRFTTVASSTALVATQPVWAALIARWRGAVIPRSAWVGIGISLAGVLVLTGIDLSVDPRHLIGDVLALVGAMLAAAYVTVSESARQTVSTATLTTGLYASSAVLLVVLCVVLAQPLTGFSAQDWLLILLLTLGAQLLGHSLINKVLATTSATVVSLAILLEMPGATLIAAIALGQVPPLAILPAVALMFAGIVLVIRAGSRTVPSETPPL